MGKRKKYSDDDGDEEDGLMASFADIMTLLLGFFIILFSMSEIDPKRFFEFGKSISEGFKDSKVTKAEVAPVDPDSKTRTIRAFQMLVSILELGDENEAIKKIEQAYVDKIRSEETAGVIDEGLKELEELSKFKSEFETIDEHIVDLILPTPLLFKPGTAVLTDSAIKKITKVGNLISNTRNVSKVKVIGHTDSVPPGRLSPFRDNWELSSLRAIAVARVLVRSGISPSGLEIIGRGSEDPLLPEVNSEGNPIFANRIHNRRVQISIARQ